MKILKQDLVSIIIRTHDSSKICLLEEAVISILGNLYKPIEIIIVAQSSDNNFISKINDIIAKYSNDLQLIQLITNPAIKDERSKNINLGIQKATGRYIGFLDDDDIYYDNYISSLLIPLQTLERYAWSYGDVALASCDLTEYGKIIKKDISFPFKQPYFSLEQLFKANFIPINSYLLDRQRIDESLLWFDEEFTVGEDYAFLLKLAIKYKPYYVDCIVSEYRIFENLSNSNIIMNEKLGIPNKDKIRDWNYALWRIERLKKSLWPNYSSGWLSLEIRKFIFYKFPSLKIFLRYQLPRLNYILLKILSKLNIFRNKNR